MKTPPINCWGLCPSVSHPNTTGEIAIEMSKLPSLLLQLGSSVRLWSALELLMVHCVIDTDLGVKTGSFSVCDTCFRSMRSGGLSQKRNVEKIAPRNKRCSLAFHEMLISDCEWWGLWRVGMLARQSSALAFCYSTAVQLSGCINEHSIDCWGWCWCHEQISLLLIYFL